MISLSLSQPTSYSTLFFSPLPVSLRRGVGWMSSWTVARVSPPRIYRVQPLALKNFPGKQGNKVGKRERCLILEVIQKLRHRNCLCCRVTELSHLVFQALRSSTTFPPTPGPRKSALLLYFCQSAGTLYSKLAQATCVEFGLKTGCGISICQ